MDAVEARHPDEPQPTPEDTAEEQTDLPGLTTWRSVYLLVVVVFVVYVVLLVAFYRAYA